MRKTNKILALCTACLIMTASFPALSASAVEPEEPTYPLGDVDMDGVITGHDAAMVSRYLNVDPDLLTEQQLALADFNEDGVVNQTDADLIHENEEMALGIVCNSDNEEDKITIRDAYFVMCYYRAISNDEDFDFSKFDLITQDTQLLLNLIDANADGAFTKMDFIHIYAASSLYPIIDSAPYYTEGRYDLFDDALAVTEYDGDSEQYTLKEEYTGDNSLSIYYDPDIMTVYLPGDVDMDGVITGHDATMVSRYLSTDSDVLTPDQLSLADFNGDGTVDQTDADLIAENEVFAIGDVLGFGKPTLHAASLALFCYANNAVGTPPTIVNGEVPTAYPDEVSSYSWKDGKIYVNGSEITSDSAYYQNIYDVLGYPMGEVDTISLLNYHLIDQNGDGAITIEDAYQLLLSYSRYSAGLTEDTNE